MKNLSKPSLSLHPQRADLRSPGSRFQSRQLRFLVFAVWAGGCLVAQAAPGELDTSFAGSGKSRTAFGGGNQDCQAMALQVDGKRVLAGGGRDGGGRAEFQLVRFGTNNLLDNTFGAGGAVFTAFNPSLPNDGSAALAVAIQSDGRIIAGGWAQNGVYADIALARYNPDGSLDASFGNGGKVVTDVGTESVVRGLALDTNGKIVITGEAGTNFLVARYQTNGVLDISFGTGGIVMTDVGGGSPQTAQALLLESSSGKYIAVGTGQGGTTFAVVQYTTNGLLDTTFGGGTGKVFTPIPGYLTATAYAVAYQSSSSAFVQPTIVVAGGTFNSTVDAIYAIVRYHLDGTLDTTFGNGGIVTGTFAPGSTVANAAGVVVQGVGISQPRKIIIGGYGAALSAYFGLARYNANGTLDTTFGGGTGKVALSFGPAGRDAGTALLYEFGKYSLAGYSGRDPSGSHTDFAVARFNSDGSLDTTLNGGIILADVIGTAYAQALALQGDGKSVMAGTAYYENQESFAAARYNADGSMDSGFGVNGRVTTQVGPTNSNANAVIIQGDNKIVAGGFSYTFVPSYYQFALVRYNPDGSVDTGFGSGGRVLTLINGFREAVKSLALQRDGRILAVGYSYNSLDYDFAVVRYTTNGLLDGTFNGTGKVTTTIANGQDVANSVAVQTDGRIVVAGYAQVAGTTNFALIRLNTDGTLDNAFGSFGRVSTDFGSGSIAYGNSLALQSDGRIVLAGQVLLGGRSYVAISRYTSDGVLDPSFGTGGKVITQVGLTYDSANGVAVQYDGKIIVAGPSSQGSGSQYAVLRYNSDGSLDSSYGLGGKVIVSFEDGSDLVSAVALDQIGRAVLAGSAGGLFGIARLQSEPFLRITSINRLGNGQVVVQGVGIPSTNHTVLGLNAFGSGSFNPLGSVTTDSGGFWNFLDTSAVSLNQRFYRLSFP